MSEKTYKVRGGVEFRVNDFGCLIDCNDWETLYPAAVGKPTWYGTCADLFVQGRGGKYWATQAFSDLTGWKKG